MISIDLLWYLLVPLFLSAFTIFVLHRFCGGITWIQSTGAALLGFVVGAGLLFGAFHMGKGVRTGDTQILNGEITGKTRTEGSYEESYDCHCHQSCSGSGKSRSCSRQCDTCYTPHYTVDWRANSNVGSFTIDSKDWTSRAVYEVPDPDRYTRIMTGDPVSTTQKYTNYIKGAPQSIFRPPSAALKEKFKGQIPAYPEVYDFYHVDRIIGVGVAIPNLREWNDKLAQMMKDLGPTRQANAILVFVNTTDSSYFEALQDAWVGAKKNDIVIVIGTTNFPSGADWVRIMALTQDDLFQVRLRDDILALKELTPDAVLGALDTDTQQLFKRKHMRDFAYLDAEISPPGWVMATGVVAVILAYLGMWWYLITQGGFSMPGSSRRFRNY